MPEMRLKEVTMIFSLPLTFHLPSSYNDIKPHHLIALYSSYHILASILLSNYLIHKIHTHLCNHATALLSKFSDSDLCLPLLYLPISLIFLPNVLIRYAFRVRCNHTLIELGTNGAENNIPYQLTFERLRDRTLTSSRL